MDGAIYTIAFDVTDGAGNTATTVSNTGVIYDVTTQAPTLASPAGSSTDNATLDIDFTLPEAASSGTVKMSFTQTGGSADANSPHIITFTAAFESAAQHTMTLVGGDLSTSANVASVSSDTNDALVDGGVYDVKIEYQDGVGNTAATVTNSGFTYDTTAPVISATAPAQDATVNTTQVSYTLSEAVVSGTVTWTRTGGTADGGSPHAQALTGAELNTGAHSNITLTNNPTLVDGAIYTIAFDVTDGAGNTATTVSNTGVNYDVTTQAPTLASPAGSSTDNATLDIDFTLPEAASSGTVKMSFTQTGGSADVNSPHIITFTAAFESAAQHTMTLVGGDLSTSANVASVSSDTNDALVDGGVYDVKIEYQDGVGNTAATVTNSGFTYDTTAPVISATAPAQDATVNTTQVSYTLSEAVLSGTITWMRTGGTADGGSPHAQALTGAELNTGAHSNITLTNNPTLVDGAIYTVSYDVTDGAGNAATTISNTGVIYDVTTQAPTLASPAGSSTDNATLDIDFTLPEAASSGTVKMTFTQTGGSADANSPHIITFMAAFETAAQHTVTLVGGDLSTSANVASVSSDTNDALVDGAVYDVKIEYQDGVGNTAATVTNSGFTYDTSAPVISATAPAQDATVNTTQVSYTLSEAVASGTITWTQTGGTADPGSPHAQALTGTELNTGAHSNITLINNPTLVDGAIYTIAFDVTDVAGNTATTVTNTGVIYDVTTQAPTLASPAGSSTDNATLDIDFTLPEAASSGTVKMTFTQTGGSADVNSPHIITFTAAFETATQHTVTLVGGDLSTSANVASVSSDTNDALVDGAVYDVKIEYQDGVGNTAATVTNNGFTYDVTTQAPTLAAPAASSQDDQTLAYDLTLPEAALGGTVKMTFTHASGLADANAPHVITFGVALETAAQHTGTLVGNDLSTSTNVASISSDPSDALVDGAVYDVKIEYQDDLGNTVASVTNTSFTYEIPGTAALTGTITDDGELDIREGASSTIILTLTNDLWDPTVGANNAVTTALINGLTSAELEGTGWNAVVKAGLTFNEVDRTSGTVVTITLPAFSSYDITANETITVTIPATALQQLGGPLIANPNFTITFGTPALGQVHYRWRNDDGAPWFDPRWSYRNRITVDNNQVDGNLTNFPVYVDLSSLGSNFFTNVTDANGGDIRVTTGDGVTELARQVVAIDTGGETGELHFKADSLSSSVDTSFYIYYGSLETEPAAAAANGSDSVWSNGYEGIWHLDEDQANAGNLDLYKDSSGNNNHGDDEITATDQEGRVGAGQEFDRSDDKVAIDDAASLDITGELTVTTWMKSPALGQLWVMMMKGNAGIHFNYAMYQSTTTGEYIFGFVDGILKEEHTSGAGLQVDTWYQLTATYNDATNSIVMYVNGNVVGDDNQGQTASLSTNNTGLFLGTDEDALFVVNGHLDEVRISNIARTGPWISTGYKNQNNPGVGGFLASVGSEEPAPGATWASAAEDTNVTVATNVPKRLRIEISNSGTEYATGTTYRLEVSGANPASCSAGVYGAVPTDGSGHWQVVDVTDVVDGVATTNVSGLTDANITFVVGEVKDTANETSGITLTNTEFTEVEFAVQATGNAVTGAQYCLRLTNGGSETNFTYTEYAQVGIGSGVNGYHHQ